MSNQYPNQPQSPYGQQPQWGQQAPAGPQWGAPQPPAPKKRRGLKIVLGVVGGIIAIGVIAGIASGGNKTDGTADTADKASTTAPAATGTTAAPKAKATAPAQPKPAAKPVTVLSESGHGIKTTAKFTVHGDWDLHYTYSCASFGMKGNFAVMGQGGDFPDVMVNELGMKGADTTHQHDGGTLYLDINSECSWTIKVVDIP